MLLIQYVMENKNQYGFVVSVIGIVRCSRIPWKIELLSNPSKPFQFCPFEK